MLHRHLLALTTALVGLALPASAQGVGSRIPEVELADFGQTGAKSFEDYYGRAVLIEFFAYW
jgi:hypothetical protein